MYALWIQRRRSRTRRGKCVLKKTGRQFKKKTATLNVNSWKKKRKRKKFILQDKPYSLKTARFLLPNETPGLWLAAGRFNLFYVYRPIVITSGRWLRADLFSFPSFFLPIPFRNFLKQINSLSTSLSAAQPKGSAALDVSLLRTFLPVNR